CWRRSVTGCSTGSPSSSAATRTAAGRARREAGQVPARRRARLGSVSPAGLRNGRLLVRTEQRRRAHPGLRPRQPVLHAWRPAQGHAMTWPFTQLLDAWRSIRAENPLALAEDPALLIQVIAKATHVAQSNLGYGEGDRNNEGPF